MLVHTQKLAAENLAAESDEVPPSISRSIRLLSIEKFVIARGAGMPVREATGPPRLIKNREEIEKTENDGSSQKFLYCT